MSAAKSLIKAYEDYDDERFQACLKNGIWRSMDNEVSDSFFKNLEFFLVFEAYASFKSTYK